MRRKVDPRKQFSKWLARYGAIFWGIFMIVIAALIYLRPEAAISCVYLALIVTGNKMLDTLAYTQNSMTEKMLLAALDKTKMEFSLRAGGKIPSSDDEDEDSESEGDGNG